MWALCGLQWLAWFLNILEEALQQALALVDRVLHPLTGGNQ
ncbi:hypothetical protein SAMN04488490_0149 [Marinobacter sp. LV10R510-11A]|nr:hypothetical protein [Marinobacter sp. LV10R510-11A]SOB74644.1 hypothetical protein SAMN04488490_0149 [Marinobacter sp. LV10R510-11A]